MIFLTDFISMKYEDMTRSAGNVHHSHPNNTELDALLFRMQLTLHIVSLIKNSEHF